MGATAVYIGAVETDSSGYPDCRRSFIEAFNRAVQEGTKPETEIVVKAPFLNLKKKDIVLMGRSLDAPFHLTWSCYVDEEIACGECDSCFLRLRAFREAGVDDPIPYRSKI
jgi:7-cyano-7-deazaguanine synthase